MIELKQCAFPADPIRPLLPAAAWRIMLLYGAGLPLVMREVLRLSFATTDVYPESVLLSVIETQTFQKLWEINHASVTPKLDYPSALEIYRKTVSTFYYGYLMLTRHLLSLYQLQPGNTFITVKDVINLDIPGLNNPHPLVDFVISFDVDFLPF